MSSGNKNLLETLPPEDLTSIAKIIVSLSAKFVEKFPFLVMDDCIQIVWKELIVYQSYFDPDKSKVTTWTYKLVKDTLTSYALKEYGKTQNLDNIEDHTFSDNTVQSSDNLHSFSDLMELFQTVLSEKGFEYLQQLEVNPRICFSELAEKLRVSERDLVYLRDEVRIITKHVLRM